MPEPAAIFTVTDPQAPRRIAAQGVEATARAVFDTARTFTPVNTGRLRAGWRMGRLRDPATFRVYNDVDYARFVEYGTKHMRPQPMLGRSVTNIRAYARRARRG